MFDFLDKLRAKPAHTRKIIAAAGTSVITGVIFFIWLFYWAGSSGLSRGADAGPEDNSSSAISAPANLIAESWWSFEDTLKESFSGIKNQLKF